MKTHKIAGAGLFATALLLSGIVTSCADDINLNTPDQSKYEVVGKTYGFLENAIAPNASIVDLYKTEGRTLKLNVMLSKKADRAVDVKLAYDAAVVADYNARYKTSFEVLPASLISIANGGNAVVAPGYLQSLPVEIKLVSSAELVEGKSYALPIKIETVTDGVELTGNSSYIYWVKYQGTRMSCDKPYNMKIVSCMEINDTNPLNNGELFLKSSGKALFDYVVLFSANINYNAETGRVYVNCNPNIRAVLDNREHYLKPLKDMGMKIILGILGNHDQSGVANLTQPTAAYFAQELKYYCDAYDLDGVFFDDEYSNYSSGPGFESGSSSAYAARLLYETKRAMPDRVVMAYLWSTLSSNTYTIDGMLPGQYVDYAIADYGAGGGNYTGMATSQKMPWSQEFNLGRSVMQNTTTAINLRTGGYGGNMIFALDPTRINWPSRLNSLGYLTQGIWGEDIYWTGKTHLKDW